MTEKNLAELLEEAFGDLPVPAPEAIIRNPAVEDLECGQVAELLGGRHWRDLTAADLMFEHAALNFLSPEGFRFYLPAFTRFALLEFDAADMVPIVIVWSLGYSDDDTQQRIALLDDSQRAVMADCVTFFGDRAPDYLTPEEIDCAIANLNRARHDRRI
jgi:hypothetical protein